MLASLYPFLPVPLQHLACSIEGYRIQRTRFGSHFSTYLRDYESRTLAAPAAITDWRDARLQIFLARAVDAPAYASDERYRRAAGNGVVSDLPVLSKADVQQSLGSFRLSLPKTPVETHHTSGSTGAGLVFPTTRQSVAEQWAVWWRYRRWHGIPLDAWCGYFGGRPIVPTAARRAPFWRYNLPGHQILFSGFHLSDASVRSYVSELRKRRPPWLHGYPSMIALLAGYMKELSIAPGYQVRWITTGAENLLSHQKAVIEAVFGVAPRQHYGMAEGVANASECPLGRLHIDEDYSFVELIPDAGGFHKIVGTNFTNLAFPLIRYDTGDVAELDRTPCHCGRPGRIVTRLDGRRDEYIVLPSGAKVGRLDHVFKDQVHVREAQIYQASPSAVVLYIVRSSDFTAADEASLLREARARLGPDIGISVQYTERIPRTGAGKFRFVRSELPPI